MSYLENADLDICSCFGSQLFLKLDVSYKEIQTSDIERVHVTVSVF